MATTEVETMVLTFLAGQSEIVSPTTTAAFTTPVITLGAYDNYNVYIKSVNQVTPGKFQITVARSTNNTGTLLEIHVHISEADV